MIKLYKSINNETHYWETWDNENKSATFHWGIIGQTGKSKKITSGLFKKNHKEVQTAIDQKIEEGYTEFEEMDKVFLEVIYSIEGMGTSTDLDKRHKLEGRLNELLGWTGLGHVDGGSIGSGTMEVGCEVVNFEIAKKVIAEDLKNSEYHDYKEIKAIEFESELDKSLQELITSTPFEVINIYVFEPENVDERISAIGTIHANTIGVNEASIEFVPNDSPPSKNEVLSWIWTFRPDLGNEILTQEIEPEFKKLIESYNQNKMNEFWDYINE